MYGSSNSEAVEIDEVTETVDDLIELARPWCYKERDPAKKVGALEKVVIFAL